MPEPSWSGKVSRHIVRRIVVEGDLVLQTPAHLGNGDGNKLIDMPLLTDPLDGRTPLLTGASIAGALRSYLRERQHGFRAKLATDEERAGSASVLLFGAYKGDRYGEQSPLIVEDARGRDAAIELRDGVRLAGESRTAAEESLFTIEMWAAGTTFPLRFELIVRQNDDAPRLKQALATALAGLTDGGITIGARKRRGYGQVSVTGWRCKEYDLTRAAGLLDWIANGANKLDGAAYPDIAQVLLNGGETIADHRRLFHLKAEFSLNGSLLIRSGSGPDLEQADKSDADGQRPDAIHLHSARPDALGTRVQKPIVSGTSLAGALRARALKIARVIAPPTQEGETRARGLIDCLFGADMEITPQPKASRLVVYEHVVDSVQNRLVQNRVSIDRFTGGARDGFLFNEQPLFGSAQSLVTIELQLANPQDGEIGLLLLLLKDLWTGDLPLGGEISIGRGRLSGKSCHLAYQNGQVRTWDLQANKAGGLHMTADTRQDLEYYVAQLHAHLEGRNV